MTLFEVVRKNVTARMVADALGLRVRWNGMARCPFHPDRHPSMKLDERYYCFGCHATGDAIDFAANYLNVSKKAAAIQLAKLFNLTYDEPHCRRKKPKPDMRTETSLAFEGWQRWALDGLAKYGHYNVCQKEHHAPQPEDEKWSEPFVQALREQDTIALFQAILESGSLAEQIDLYQHYRERIVEFEKRMEGDSAGDNCGTASITDAGNACKR